MRLTIKNINHTKIPHTRKQVLVISLPRMNFKMLLGLVDMAGRLVNGIYDQDNFHTNSESYN
jgi:hypothetical protein